MGSNPLPVSKPTISHWSDNDDQTNRGLTVTWLPNPNETLTIVKYTVLLYGGVEPQEINLIVQTPASSYSINIQNLIVGTSYYCNVLTFADNDSQAASSVASDSLTVATNPDPPTEVTLTNVEGVITVSWTPSDGNGYSAITGYIIYDATSEPQVQIDTVAGTESSKILTVQVTQVVVQAATAVGLSTLAYSNTLEISTYPPLPVNTLILRVNGVRSLEVTWEKNQSDLNPVTNYSISLYTSSTIGSNTQANIPPIIVTLDPSIYTEGTIGYSKEITNLTFGYGYYATVSVVNGNGTSDPSEPSETILAADIPGPPTSVTLSLSGNDIIATWVAPLNNGNSEINGYQIHDALTETYEKVPYELNNGVYMATLTTPVTQIYITASNDAGESIPSGLSEVIELPDTDGSGPPSAPLNITATAGTKSAVVTWEAPTSSGESEITGYFITSVPDNKTPLIVGADVFTATMTKLTTGTSYTFRVSAINSVGYSGQSNSVTPYVLPSTPKIAAPVLGNLTVTLSWTAVSVGTPITSYKITRDDNSDEITTDGGNSGTYEITDGLVAGTTVTFVVTSTNENGDCLVPASIVVSPISTPQSPPHFVAYVGKIRGTALLYWAPNAPTDAGTPVTGYVLTYNEIVINLGTALTFMVYIKDGASVTFSLAAKNKVGLSEPVTATIDGIYVDPASPTLTQTVPDPPPYFVGYVGKLPGTIVLHWVPQSPINGGTSLAGYILRYNGITINLGAAAVTFSDSVVPEQPITFRLVAKNKNGLSTAIFFDLLGGGDVTEEIFPRDTVVLP